MFSSSNSNKGKPNENISISNISNGSGPSKLDGGTREVDYPKLKTNFNLCIQRMQNAVKTKRERQQSLRKQIAELLGLGRIDSARIKTDQMIREDNLCEALEILESYCEVLITSIGLLKATM